MENEISHTVKPIDLSIFNDPHGHMRPRQFIPSMQVRCVNAERPQRPFESNHQETVMQICNGAVLSIECVCVCGAASSWDISTIHGTASAETKEKQSFIEVFVSICWLGGIWS